MVGLAVTKLPVWVWGYLPSRAVLALRTAARSYSESKLLPVRRPHQTGSVESQGAQNSFFS